MSDRLRLRGWRGGIAILGVGLLHAEAGAETVFTHVHLRVPDTAAAAEWYQTLFGGEIGQGGPGPSVRFATGFIGTMRNDGGLAPPSTGGAVDHFALWVADLEDVVDRARATGATINAEPAVLQAGGPLVALIVDPWGTRVDLVEDATRTGVHHVHIVANGADEIRDWLVEVLGGTFVPEHGGDRFHGVSFGDVWLYVSDADDGARAPSRGRSLDHLGFRLPMPVAAFGQRLEAGGFPPYLIRPNPPGSDLLFFEGPGGIHVEIAESRTR